MSILDVLGGENVLPPVMSTISGLKRLTIVLGCLHLRSLLLAIYRFRSSLAFPPRMNTRMLHVSISYFISMFGLLSLDMYLKSHKSSIVAGFEFGIAPSSTRTGLWRHQGKCERDLQSTRHINMNIFFPGSRLYSSADSSSVNVSFGN